jgi:hypothetical protein
MELVPEQLFIVSRKGKHRAERPMMATSRVEQNKYKGRMITVRPEQGGSELYIDGRHFTTARDRSGGYFAARYAYVVEPTLMGLARRLVDYLNVLEARKPKRGDQKKSSLPKRC